MRPFRQVVLAAVSLLLSLAPSAAQTPGQPRTMEQSGSPARQEGQVRIQTSISFFVAGPTGDGEEAQKLRDKARRTVYEMAARECDLLESVNNNIGRQTSQQQQEGYTVNGSMSFQITLK
jgi:hypothetical protein